MLAPSVQVLSLSCSFRQKSCKIIGFCLQTQGLAPPLSEILDPPLRRSYIKRVFLWNSLQVYRVYKKSSLYRTSLRRESLLIYLKLKMGEFQYKVNELRIIPTSLNYLGIKYVWFYKLVYSCTVAFILCSVVYPAGVYWMISCMVLWGPLVRWRNYTSSSCRLITHCLSCIHLVRLVHRSVWYIPRGWVPLCLSCWNGTFSGFSIREGDGWTMDSSKRRCFCVQFVSAFFHSRSSFKRWHCLRTPYLKSSWRAVNRDVTASVYLCRLFQGTLIKHLEEHVLQGNLTQDDVMLYYTTVRSAS